MYVLGVISNVCALFKNKREKQNNGTTSFKNQGALKFIEGKIYSHQEAYSIKAELMLLRHEHVM